MKKRKKGAQPVWTPWTPPPSFNEYPFEQVLAVTQMLYAMVPADGLHEAVGRAFTFLDEVSSDYSLLSAVRRSRAKEYRRQLKQLETLKGSPEVVPYKKAVGLIMNDRHFSTVLPKFKLFVRSSRWLKIYFERNRTTAAKQLAHWPKEGIPLSQVHQLFYVHESAVAHSRANALAKLAKKRGPRFKKFSRENKAAIHELQREKIARERSQASTLPDET
jgi:hypothetical protein